MPSPTRKHPVGVTLHVTSKAIPDRLCCPSAESRAIFLQMAQAFSRLSPCLIHAYAMMDNHIHILLTGQCEDAVNHFLMRLLGFHATIQNRVLGRGGPLWRGRYAFVPITDEAHLLNSYLYIDANPWRAGIVEHPRDSPWTSFRFNALGEHNSLITPHEQILAMAEGGMSWHEAYAQAMDRYLQSSVRFKSPLCRPLYSDPLAGLQVFRVNVE